jgi:hypothetical protein
MRLEVFLFVQVQQCFERRLCRNGINSEQIDEFLPSLALNLSEDGPSELARKRREVLDLRRGIFGSNQFAQRERACTSTQSVEGITQNRRSAT